MFTERIFEPAFVGRGNTRNSSALVIGYAHYYNELILLNAVGSNANINMLIAAAKVRARMPIISIPTARGRQVLMREEWNEFDIETRDIQGYGIRTVVIANRQLTRPNGRYAFFAAENDDDATLLVGERIKASLPNSVLPDWYSYLLSKGLDNNYIQLLEGEGVRVYHLDTSRDFWQSTISAGIASGNLTF